MNYTNREVIRRLKQYDMFLESLNIANNEVQRERICDQLDKIEKQILLETNNEYEEKYLNLLNTKTSFFSEEKNRLRSIISFVEKRREYLDNRRDAHRAITGSLVELTTFLGEDLLPDFKRRLSIIEKYEANKTRGEMIIKEMKGLDIKLSETSRIVKANNRLNDSLESKMMATIGGAIDKFSLYNIVSSEGEITKKFETLEYALSLAKDNLRSAKKTDDNELILECDELLSKVTTEYNEYNEKLNILKIIDMYDKPVASYEELLKKREKLDSLLKSIDGSKFYAEVANELNKQYNTIKLEKQDIEKYEELKREHDTRNRKLYEIEEENNSKEFKEVIEEFVKNENRIRDEQVREAKREEYKERQKKLLEEQKIEASRVRRQKLIEEARLKEQQERLEKVKELQEKTVISAKKIEEKPKEEKVDAPKVEEDIKDFDTDELFENTKIVPNKVEDDGDDDLPLKPSEEIEKKKEDKPHEEKDAKVSKKDTPSKKEKPHHEEEEVKYPEIEKKKENDQVMSLFKDESSPKEVEVKENKKKNVTTTGNSIYDFLENNKNIIWKSTDTTINEEIPVIKNSNLKPEGKKVDNVEFPEIEKTDKKEGEILWKETL